MSQEQSWDDWLSHNIERECAPADLRIELINNGFSEEDADEKLMRAKAVVREKQLKPNNAESEQTQRVNLPHAIDMSTDEVEMFGIDGFLSADECMQLISLIRNNRRDSTTTEEGVSSFRTSTTCELSSIDHPMVREIEERICRYMGIDITHSEPMEGQWYEEGQEFKAHTDFFEPSSETYDLYIGSLGQRTWTFMIYLNSTAEGGSTYFTEMDLNVEPVAGTAIVWSNIGYDGELNNATMHHGMPVISGYKAVITKWFRSVDGIPRYNKVANELLPPLTKDGFLKQQVPEELYDTLYQFYQDGRDQAISESIPEYISSKAVEQPSVVVELTDELRHKVHETLQPMVEAWIGNYLEPTYVYGVREYREGAELKVHRDRIATHIASVIINIDQEVNSDWPLVIDDHYYRRHNVLLKPGEMIFYEGGRLMHGRPDKFDGKRFANVFVHYK